MAEQTQRSEAAILIAMETAKGLLPATLQAAGYQMFPINPLAVSDRWPRFCPAAHELGIRSCLGLSLTGPTGLMGCYNLYSLWRDGFAPDTRGQLEVFAGNAAGALAVAMKMVDQTQMSDDLREALTSRAVIDQATGIIMAQQRCGAGQAFDILRRGSQNRNVKVRELAAEIVRQVSGQPPEPGVFHPRRF